MKPRKQTILIMLVGLLLFAFAAVMAQTPAQGEPEETGRSLLRDGVVLLQQRFVPNEKRRRRPEWRRCRGQGHVVPNHAT